MREEKRQTARGGGGPHALIGGARFLQLARCAHPLWRGEPAGRGETNVGIATTAGTQGGKVQKLGAEPGARARASKAARCGA